MPQSVAPELAQRVRRMKREATLLQDIDSQNTGNLPGLAIGEVEEVAEASNQPAERYDDNEVNGEVMDILVFLLSYYNVIGKLDEIYHVPGHINGVATQSNHLERLAAILGDLNPDRVDNSAQKNTRDEAMRILLSMVNHYPGLGPSALTVMDETVEKVLSNRDPRFYSNEEHGVVLSPDEALLKYTFLEKFQRTMRDELRRTLRPSDWDKVADLAFQWRGGQTILDQLTIRLKTSVLS